MKLRARRKMLSRLGAKQRSMKGARAVPSAANILAEMERIYKEHRTLFERLADA